MVEFTDPWTCGRRPAFTHREYPTMSLTVNLAPELDQRLRTVARALGKTSEAFVEELIADSLLAAEDPAELARLAAIDEACGALARTKGTVARFLRDRNAEATR